MNVNCLVCGKILKQHGSVGSKVLANCHSCYGRFKQFYTINSFGEIIYYDLVFDIKDIKYNLVGENSLLSFSKYASNIDIYTGEYVYFKVGEVIPFCEKLLKLQVFL